MTQPEKVVQLGLLPSRVTDASGIHQGAVPAFTPAGLSSQVLAARFSNGACHHNRARVSWALMKAVQTVMSF